LYPSAARAVIAYARAAAGPQKKQTGWFGRRWLNTFFSVNNLKEKGTFFKEETLGTVNKKTDPNLKLLDKKWGP